MARMKFVKNSKNSNNPDALFTIMIELQDKMGGITKIQIIKNLGRIL
jgi:hypothetical protein